MHASARSSAVLTRWRQIVRGILKYWPYGSSSKELLMLNELEEVHTRAPRYACRPASALTCCPRAAQLFELMLPSVLKELIRPLFSRIAKCIECPHFQVCERAMWLWNNQEVVKLVVDNAEIREVRRARALACAVAAAADVAAIRWCCPSFLRDCTATPPNIGTSEWPRIAAHCHAHRCVHCRVHCRAHCRAHRRALPRVAHPPHAHAPRSAGL